jgi:PhzF family phenazine biosynthesis protein
LREVYELSAFIKDDEGGNPAGVVLGTIGLNEYDMRVIARKVGHSETAFVFPSTIADFNIRYFTPNEEVDVCGHATIATFSLMCQKKIVHHGSYLIETKSGLLRVSVNEDDSVFLQQNKPIFGELLSKEEIAHSLGINEDHLMEDLPIQIVSTGLSDIIIPVKSLSVLNTLSPNYPLIKELSQKYSVIGYHVFTLETLFESSSAHCRNFAPLYEIDEESATGTANAALACYLSKYTKSDQNTLYRFEQGYAMNRPSEIVVNLEFHSEEMINVQVGGYSSAYKQHKVEY